MKTQFVPFARLSEMRSLPDAILYLVKPGRGVFDEYKLIRFATRTALESFNKRAGLKPLVFTDVPKNCVVHAHQSDAKARMELHSTQAD